MKDHRATDKTKLNTQKDGEWQNRKESMLEN